MKTNERIRDLANYRIEKAEESIEASRILLENSLYAESINRSYYAILHSARGLLAYDEFDSKRHSGVISFFNQNYIKPGKIERQYSIIITSAFTIRNKSDYDDFYIASKADAEEQFKNAIEFLNKIKEYIKLVAK